MTQPATIFQADAIPGEALREAVGTFEEVLREHQSMVFSLAFHTLRDRGLAEDVAQEAFLKLSRHLPRLGSPRHVLFWLRQVTCRLCIDELRRRPDRVASLDELGEPGVEHPAPDVLMEGHLRRLVGELPEKARMVVVLRYQEDLEPAEIAALLQEPLATVKSRIQRGLARLREGLGALEGACR